MTCLSSNILYLTLLFNIPIALYAQNKPTHHWHLDRQHIGTEIEGSYGEVLHMDKYDRIWMKKNKAYSLVGMMRLYTLPTDSDEYAQAYHYPSFGVGIAFNQYQNVKMHKDQEGLWGKIIPVNYVSNGGQIWTLFGTFERPLWQQQRWNIDYTLGCGIGYASHAYNNRDNVDNELIGSPFNIYFTAGLHGTIQVASHWAVRMGVDFRHHSNGATQRPNRGTNYLAPSLGICYTPNFSKRAFSIPLQQSFKKYRYTLVGIGIGGKTLLEEWQLSQFNTPHTDPSYRKNNYHFYPSYSFQISEMYRYDLRWASGIGLDINYASGAKQIKKWDKQQHLSLSHSPWSVGIAARHEAYYHHLAATVSLGAYIFRKMGKIAEWEEKPFYERVGLRYYFNTKHSFYLGAEVKAHGTRADFTELTLGYRW